MKTRNILSTGISRLLLLAALGVTHSAWSVTRSWDGGAGTNDLGAAANWSGNTLPNPAASDVMQWNGAVTGPLALTYTTTSFAGAAGSAGLNLDLTAGQTDSLNLDASNANGFRMNGVTIAAGAGAFSVGNGVGTFNVTLGGAGGQTHAWTNNSSNLATFGSEVVFNLGGGGAHTLSLGGAGGWVLNNPVGETNGTLTMTVTGNAIATFNATNTYSGPTNLGGSGMTGVARVNASSAFGTGPIVFGSNSTSSRLELLSSLQLYNPITLPGRSVNSVAIESVAGDSTLFGTLTLGTSGNLYKIQADAGSYLTLGNATAITSNATGARDVTLQGDGTGSVNGAIVNGTAILQLTKAGLGDWTLRGANTYTGPTNVNAGRLVVTGTLGPGTTNVAAGAQLLLGTSQTLSALNIANGGLVTLTKPATAPALESAPLFESEMVAFDGADALVIASSTAAVAPEPGTISLLLTAVLGFVGRQRRARTG